jgi:hypothetical protein
VGSFTISRPALILLLGVLAVITLVLVLPQVDLLDTAFQRNTSPLALRARVTSVPLVLISAPPLLLGCVAVALRDRREQSRAVAIESEQIPEYSLRC